MRRQDDSDGRVKEAKTTIVQWVGSLLIWRISRLSWTPFLKLSSAPPPRSDRRRSVLLIGWISGRAALGTAHLRARGRRKFNRHRGCGEIAHRLDAGGGDHLLYAALDPELLVAAREARLPKAPWRADGAAAVIANLGKVGLRNPT